MRFLLLAVATAVSLPMSRAEAQVPETTGAPAGRVCTLRVEPGGVTSREGTVINILDPFRVTCTDGANLRASSGTFDQVERVVTLTGDVYFEDATRSLTSDRAVYDNLAGVLHAMGNVVFVDRVEGTTLTGPELEYFRATEQREQALVNAYGRPRLTMRRPAANADTTEVDTAGAAAPADSVGVVDDAAPADTSGMPLTIDADQMTIVGEDDLTAVGNVVIQDDDMRALADEAEQRGASETLELRGNASIHSREYSLAAEVIFATIPEGSIHEVEARRNARLLGEDLNVEAPQLNLLFEDNLLQRTVARSDSSIAPGVRPLATSPTFRLEADSIDAGLPGQQLEVVVAIGNARGEMIDTTRVAVPADSLEASGENQPLEIAADSMTAGAQDSVQAAMPDRVAAAPADTLPGAPIDRAVGIPVDTLPGVRVDTVYAAGEAAPGPAVAEGAINPMFASGDTVLTVSAEQLVQNDWITGDTITGYFTTVVAAPADSAAVDAGETEGGAEELDADADLLEQEPDTTLTAGADTTIVLERLVALGAARSLYHVAPEEGAPPETRPGINFLSAARIELTFEDGQVEVAEVSGLRRGLYLEPLAATDAEPAEGEEDPEGEPTTEETTEEEGAGEPQAGGAGD